jgi:undecaprenyl diphosphate synthase
MSLIHDIDKNKVPSHVAIIMDGNGRWAQQHGKVRVMGHSAGVDSVKLVLRAADNIGVKFLTLYAFSIENWNRPKYEVNAIISLIMRTLKNDLPDFMENNVRFETIGDHSRLTSKSLATLQHGHHLRLGI